MIRWLWREAVRRCPGYAELRSHLTFLHREIQGIDSRLGLMERKQKEIDSRLAEWENGAPHGEYLK